MALKKTGVELEAKGANAFEAALKSGDQAVAAFGNGAEQASKEVAKFSAEVTKAERIDGLTDKIQLQQRQLGILSQELAKTTDKYGEGSIQAQKKQLALDQLSGSIKTNEARLNSLQAELAQEAAATKVASTATEKFGDEVKVTANKVEAAAKEVQNAGRSFDAFGEIVTGALRKVGDLAVSALLEASKAVVAFGVDSIKMAGDFEAGTNRLASVAGSSLAEAGFSLDDVRDKALDMGAKTQYSAAQAQDAMIELVKGGVAIKDVMGGATDATLTLAAAGELELATAAGIVAKQLGVWASTGLEAAQVADLMAQAANASTVDVEELALGMANVGGVAKIAGLSFQETVTALAQIAPGFSSAADAGTSFKTFLSSLQPTTAPAKKAMIELGLATADGNSKFYDAQGNFIGMAAAAELLKTKTEGLSEAERLMALRTIFGSDAIRAAALIAEGGGAAFAGMGAAMDAAGTAAEQAAKRNQGFNFALESMQGSIDTVRILLMDGLLPVLADFMNAYITPAINAVGAFVKMLNDGVTPVEALAAAIKNLPAPLKDFITTIAVGAIEAQAALTAFGNTEWGQTLQRGAGVVAAYFAGPFATEVSAGVGVVQAKFTELGGDEWWADVQRGASALGTYMANDFPGDLQRGAAVVKAGFESMSAAGDEAANSLQAKLTAFAASPWGKDIAAGAKVAADYFSGPFVTEVTAGSKKVEDNVNKLAAYFAGPFQTEVSGGVKKVQDDWAAFTADFNAGVKKVEDAVNSWVKSVTDAGESVKKAFNTAIDGIKKMWDGFNWADVGSAVITGIISGITGSAGRLAGAAVQAAKDAFNAAKAFLETGSPSKLTRDELGKPFTEGMALGIIDGIDLMTGAAADLGVAALTELTSIGNDARELWGEAMRLAGQDGAQRFLDQIVQVGAKAKQAIREAFQQSLDFKASIPRAAAEAQALVQSIFNPAKMAEELAKPNGAVLQKLAAAVGGALAQAGAEAQVLGGLDPEAAGQFYDFRVSQIEEIARLEQEQIAAKTKAERLAIQERINLLRESQVAERTAFTNALGESGIGETALAQIEQYVQLLNSNDNAMGSQLYDLGNFGLMAEDVLAGAQKKVVTLNDMLNTILGKRTPMASLAAEFEKMEKDKAAAALKYQRDMLSLQSTLARGSGEAAGFGEGATGAFNEASLMAQQFGMIDPDAAEDFFSLRLRQIKEIAALEASLIDAKTEQEKAAILARMDAIRAAQQTELLGFALGDSIADGLQSTLDAHIAALNTRPVQPVATPGQIAMGAGGTSSSSTTYNYSPTYGSAPRQPLQDFVLMRALAAGAP